MFSASSRIRILAQRAYISQGQPPWRSLTSGHNNIGEDTYQRALEALAKANTFQVEIQEKRNRQQYEAWERAQQKKTPISGGVAVVKTIAKQTRKGGGADQEQHDTLLREGHDLMKEAALKHGHSTALVRLGNEAVEKEDIAKAMEYYRQAKSAEGYFNLGHLLWTGSEDEVELQSDPDAAMEAFQRAIDLGDSDAMYFVGVQHLSRDESEGLDLVTKAANAGHSGALYYIALLHYSGNEALGIPACSKQEFVTRLDQAADAGDGEALFLRGHGYYHGDDGRPQDHHAALDNFLLATDAGHADAAVSAGAMLHQGVAGIIPKNQQRAFELYQVAGELGSLEGWRNVVACYALGEGVPQSKETAKYIAKTMLKEDDETAS